MNNTKTNGIIQSIKDSRLIKILLIGFLIILLQIPIFNIQNVIRERRQTRDGAVSEITSKWGNNQSIVGPKIVVPYIVRWTEFDNDGKERSRSKTVFATFLPEKLEITGKANCEIRYRGIYEVPVYRMSLNLNGRFMPPDLTQWKIDENDILWDRAYLSVEISDARAIVEPSILSWNDKKLEFLPSSGEFNGSQQGIHTKMKDNLDGETFDFSFPIVINGSMRAFFAPIGKETEVILNSNWNAPSFQGTWLPTERTFSNDGFEAIWKIPFLGRNYPQSWRSCSGYENSVWASLFGVDMISPVDHYRMSERSVKYQLLFIFLTFIALWLFEVLTAMKIHFMQYLLVGGGICVFYLLELSLAEHLGFVSAYIIASASIILLITLYSLAILKTPRKAIIMGIIVTLLYSFLYVVLMIQDYALLIGSVALFVILAIVMYLTRKIDWYSAAGNKQLKSEKE